MMLKTSGKWKRGSNALIQCVRMTELGKIGLERVGICVYKKGRVQINFLTQEATFRIFKDKTKPVDFATLMNKLHQETGEKVFVEP